MNERICSEHAYADRGTVGAVSEACSFFFYEFGMSFMGQRLFWRLEASKLLRLRVGSERSSRLPPGAAKLPVFIDGLSSRARAESPAAALDLCRRAELLGKALLAGRERFQFHGRCFRRRGGHPSWCT